MRALIMTDQEGVSGVVSFQDQAYPEGKYVEEAKRLLTAEVNAAVDALVAEGVEEILVCDGHGAGAMAFVDLHPAARLLHGRPLPPWSVLQSVFRGYEVTLLIGQHAMAGADRATLNHTQNSREVDYYRLNGHPIGEIAQWALYAGALGIPLVFLSGDEAACREAEALIPGITTAAVKIGLGRSSAISLSRKEAHRLIGEGVGRAVRKQKREPLAPLVWKGPFLLEKRFMTTEAADRAMGSPRYERIDTQTVRLRGDAVTDVIYA